MAPLPIDDVLTDVVVSVCEHGAAVVEAEPGAGKTTRVPSALLDVVEGQVVVLEPRRLAARLAATRVAVERGGAVGDEVGYQVRFENRTSQATRLRFVTEGILLRQLMSDPELRGVGAIVLDEIHERHLTGDVVLALAESLRRRRGLKVVAMSATLDAEPVAKLLGDAPRVRSEGRQFPIAIEYVAASREPLERQVAMTVRRLVRDEAVDGHVLVFLPGAAEIRRAEEACAALARDEGVAVLPLHGDLPPSAQDAAVGPSDRRKVLLSTNVAESSLTIDGVVAVVDSGLHKQARATGLLPELREVPISQASAKQRAGRAGRTGPGRCVRLYSEGDLLRRPSFDTPEVERVELDEAVLAVSMAGRRMDELSWLTPPPAEAVQRAQASLRAIGAVDEKGPTELGRRLARLPLSPRLGRVLYEACRRDVVEEAATALAVVAERVRAGRSVNLWHHVEAFEDRGTSRRKAGMRAKRQLVRAAERLRVDRLDDVGPEPVTAALLTGFVDRVGKVVGQDGHRQRVALAGGGMATVADGEGFLIVLEARQSRPSVPATVSLLAPVSADLLLDVAGDQVEMSEERLYDRARDRVDVVEEMRLGRLVLHGSRSRAKPGPETLAVLLEALGDAPVDPDLSARVAHARAAGGKLPAFDEAAQREALRRFGEGATSLAELKALPLATLWMQALDADAQRDLQRLAPATVALAEKRVPVHYPAHAPAFVEGYVQDFFGLADGPRLGTTPLTIKLWAPNRRPLQVTDDLAGFWHRHYPDLKRQLSRRYPKHHWPAEPAKAPAKLLERHL